MPIRKVLLVDDDADIRSIGALSLEGVGHWAAVCAASGDEAIRLALRERPDVILLDIMMPDKDGIATMAELRALPETASIPIVVMTAKAQKQEVEHYTRLGAAGVIVKPFDPMLLPAELRRLVEGSAP